MSLNRQLQPTNQKKISKSSNLPPLWSFCDWIYFQRSTQVQWALRPSYPPFSSPLQPSLLQQSSNELKGQSTNKTISRNESLRCVNALLIPVSKFHPPAVCCPLMRNKTPRSREGGWGNGSMLRLLHSRLHTHTHKSYTLTLHLTTPWMCWMLFTDRGLFSALWFRRVN